MPHNNSTLVLKEITPKKKPDSQNKIRTESSEIFDELPRKVQKKVKNRAYLGKPSDDHHLPPTVS